MIRISAILLLTIFVAPILIAQNPSASSSFNYKKGFYSLLDAKGKKVKIEPFTYAEPFSEGLAVVEKNLKFGYINEEGTLVIDFQFYDAGDFIDGIAYASVDGKYGFINKKGEFVIPQNFELALNFDGDYARVKKVNTDTIIYGKIHLLTGLINKSGELLGGEYFTSIRRHPGDSITAHIKDSVFTIYPNGIIKFDSLTKDEKFVVVEEMPEYPGGQQALMNYLIHEVRYPLSASKNNISERVYTSFVINGRGNVENIEPAKISSPLFMKENKRILSNMPQWKPGKQNGKSVKVSYTVPINYVFK